MGTSSPPRSPHVAVAVGGFGTGVLRRYTPACAWGASNADSHRYLLTPLGRRVAFFMAKSFARVVRPVYQRLDPQLSDDAADPLRRAWNACERALDAAIAGGKMAA